MIDFRKKLLRFLPLTFDQVAPQHETEIAHYADLPPGFHGKNPGLVALEDGYLVCIRCVNYVYNGLDINDRVLTTGDRFTTVNRFLLIDREFRLRRTLPDLDNSFDDIEDIKLFVFDGVVMGIGSCMDPERGDDARSIGLLTIDPGFSGGHCQVIASPFSLRYEKNWAPFVHEGALHFIYSFDPLIILRYDPATKSVLFADSRFAQFTQEDLKFLVGGSSAGLPVPGGFLFAAHRRRISLPRLDRTYVSRLYHLDATGMTLTAGPFFSIGPATIQFVNGLALSESDLVFSYGQVDKNARICRVPAARLTPSSTNQGRL